MTKEYLTKAQNIILTAIRTQNFRDLQVRIEKELNLIPAYALQIVNELALYENQFTTKQLKKYSPVPITKIPDEVIKKAVPDIKISTTIGKPSHSIKKTYSLFAQTKTTQYMQMIQDAQVNGDEEQDLIAAVEEKTKGLFTTQNLALASLAIIGTANYVRNQVSSENALQVEWTLDLELNNCPYCEDMANDSPYDPEDVDGLIPAHANCGCTLIPIFDALGGEDDADV